jgi:hypothetical protein
MQIEILNSEPITLVELKHCPRCEEPQPLAEFGVCRARKDGLNLYCKRCIREKINLARQSNRARLAAQRAALRAAYRQSPLSMEKLIEILTPAPPRPRGRPTPSSGSHRISLKFSPKQRVVKALQWGPLQFNDLAYAARMSRDDLSDVLPSVMLWPADKSQKVHSKNGTGPRVYFLQPPEQSQPQVRGRSVEESSLWTLQLPNTPVSHGHGKA